MLADSLSEVEVQAQVCGVACGRSRTSAPAPSVEKGDDGVVASSRGIDRIQVDVTLAPLSRPPELCLRRIGTLQSP